MKIIYIYIYLFSSNQPGQTAGPIVTTNGSNDGDLRTDVPFGVNCEKFKTVPYLPQKIGEMEFFSIFSKGIKLGSPNLAGKK